MSSYLGFLFFGRRSSKERGLDLENFFGKIDEIQKRMIYTKLILAHFKAFLLGFLIKNRINHTLIILRILSQLISCTWVDNFIDFLDLHIPLLFSSKKIKLNLFL